MDRKKRKRVSSEADEQLVQSRTICVIHFPNSAEQGFTPFTEERLSQLKDIRDRRLALPVDSKQRMPHICQQVPDSAQDDYGYHRDCYKKFTAHISKPPTDPCQPEPRRPQRVPSDKSEKTIFKPSCIFCDVYFVYFVKPSTTEVAEWTMGCHEPAS